MVRGFGVISDREALSFRGACGIDTYLYKCYISSGGRKMQSYGKRPAIRAQASLEYFILFAVIAVLTIVSLNKGLPTLIEKMQGPNGFFHKAAQKIIE